MRIVVDTNVLLISISRKSPFNWIFQALLNREYVLCVNTDILLEYEEIIARHMSKQFAEDTLALLLELENLIRVEKYYHWRLLKNEDDDKFVDCAIACNATFILTEDADFKPLMNIPFPKVRIISIQNFKELITQSI
ncbi:MAG: putative toxin-antitoxin system toxin component, PIN family [Saprospiraceae bacterium]